MKAILIILLILLTLRLILPYLILYFINRALAKGKAYKGRVKKISIKLYGGKLKLREMVLHKNDHSGAEAPFFKAAEIELSFEWIALFHKTFMGTIRFDQPQLDFVKENAESKNNSGEPFKLKNAFERLIPFTVNIEFKNGTVRYRDLHSKAKVDVSLTQLQLLALSVSNIKENTDPLPAKVKANATVYEGTLDIVMNVNPLAERIEFDLNTEVKGINLILLNDFLRAYARIDVNQGTFGMYTEVAAKNGSFKGYIKPVFKDLDLLGAEDSDDKLFRKLWEGFVAVGIQVLKNKKTDQLATKISIEGDFKDPHVNILSGVIAILKNAFIQSLKPSLDDVIDVSSVKEKVEKSKKFLKNIFRSDREEESSNVSL